MKRVLVLGAGLVARPLIHYLLTRGVEVTVASRTQEKAAHLVGGHPLGKAVGVDVTSEPALHSLIPGSDVVVSLVPYAHHVAVARLCIDYGVSMVTTSYVSDAMNALDEDARAAGILIMNEIGLDPGIDHMSAMQIIDRVHREGGEILSFRSYCGGLPAPEACDNPFGYKFSWSPRGVVLAARNPARYLENGEVVEIPGEELFNHYIHREIDGMGTFEGYPNRNSLGYIETYGIPEVRTLVRGTLRNQGWCATWKKIGEAGWLDDGRTFDLSTMTFRSLTALLIESGGGDVRSELAQRLGLPVDSAVLDRLEWLGLFSDASLPVSRGTALDALVEQLWRKLQFGEGERDMIVLQHDFDVKTGHGAHRRVTSTLIEFGIPRGDTAMARTVALPAAICTRMMLEGKIALKGVHVPVMASIYEPVLKELEELGISCREMTADAVS